MIKATYIDHMGSDLRVVNAARVSFGKQSDWDYRNESYDLKDKDIKLTGYLGGHGHYAPFGHCFATFHVKAPIFVARQLVKHEYLRMSEISRRYVKTEPEFYKPDAWREAVPNMKQGSGDDMEDNGLTDLLNVNDASALAVYKALLESGVAAEQARMVLPQNIYTEWYWSGSLDAFANMYNLRMGKGAQYETSLVASQIGDVMKELYPHAWEALTCG